MSSLKPITVYGDVFRPNPWKVIMILEELQLPYRHEIVPIDQIKKEPFIKINPNGRLPAVHDPNTNLTIWESAAIVEYLVETYDKESVLTYTSFPEKWHLRQWMMFQATGQGPYYGQAVWFRHYHSEKVQSARDRYDEHVLRVLGVLDDVLKEREWLVGDKCTYVDISFVAWDMMLPFMFGDDFKGLEIEKKFPHYYAWNTKLKERSGVKKAIELKYKNSDV